MGEPGIHTATASSQVQLSLLLIPNQIFNPPQTNRIPFAHVCAAETLTSFSVSTSSPEKAEVWWAEWKLQWTIWEKVWSHSGRSQTLWDRAKRNMWTQLAWCPRIPEWRGIASRASGPRDQLLTQEPTSRVKKHLTTNVISSGNEFQSLYLLPVRSASRPQAIIYKK